MAKRATKKKKRANGGANLGFEATLCAAADKLRNDLDAAECKHVMLDLICPNIHPRPLQGATPPGLGFLAGSGEMVAVIERGPRV